MNTLVYIDGFNLYYGALRGTPYKWLDVAQMCRILLPKHNITQFKYYTAKVSARPNDPLQPVRQQAYFRALMTITKRPVSNLSSESTVTTTRPHPGMAHRLNWKNTAGAATAGSALAPILLSAQTASGAAV